MHPSFRILLESLGYALVGAGLSIPLLLFNIKYALQLGWIDWPKARGVAENHTPIVGHGLALLLLLTIGYVDYLFGFQSWFLLTAALIAIMGYFDDRSPIRPFEKMILQILCVLLVVFFDSTIQTNFCEKYGTAGYFWAVFFIVALMNAVNFVDGIDGLAGSVIIAGSLGILLLSGADGIQGHPQMITASIMMGAMVPFLYFNIIKRRGFLGNLGSYFFAYVLAVLHLSIPIEAKDPISRLSISGLCFLVPIADSLMVIIVRFATLRSPFQPDRGHLHHRLLQTGLPLRWILLSFGIVEVIGLVTAWFMVSERSVLMSNLPLVVCLGFGVLCFTLILLIEKASRRRIQSFLQRMDHGESVYLIRYQLKTSDGRVPSSLVLQRLEAKMSAEIRVSDTCFSDRSGTLFLAVNSSAEPIQGILGRLERILTSEKLSKELTLEQASLERRPAEIYRRAA